MPVGIYSLRGKGGCGLPSSGSNAEQQRLKEKTTARGHGGFGRAKKARRHSGVLYGRKIQDIACSTEGPPKPFIVGLRAGVEYVLQARRPNHSARPQPLEFLNTEICRRFCLCRYMCTA